MCLNCPHVVVLKVVELYRSWMRCIYNFLFSCRDIIVFWDVVLCSLVGIYQYFEAVCCLQLQDRRVF